MSGTAGIPVPSSRGGRQPPSMREIGDGTGLVSTSSVGYHLRALEAGGLIRRNGGKQRGIAVCGPDVVTVSRDDLQAVLGVGAGDMGEAELAALARLEATLTAGDRQWLPGRPPVMTWARQPLTRRSPIHRCCCPTGWTR
jgi:LexA DNA binding domain